MDEETAIMGSLVIVAGLFMALIFLFGSSCEESPEVIQARVLEREKQSMEYNYSVCVNKTDRPVEECKKAFLSEAAY